MYRLFLFAIIYTLLMTAACSCFAQQLQGKALADSMVGELPRTKSDTNKVKLLVALSKTVYASDPARGLHYASEALELAQELKWVKGQASAQVAMGVNYEQRSDLANAINCYFSGLKLSEQIDNKKGIASSCWGIGNIYNVQKNYTKSLQYQLKALEIFRQMGDNRSVSSLMGNIANNYLMQNQLDKALEYYLQSLPMKEEAGDPLGLSITLTNIGSVYFKKAEYPQAIHYYARSLSKISIEDAKSLYGRTLSNMGACYLKIAMDSIKTSPDTLIPQSPTTDLQKGMELIEQAIKISSETGDVEQLYNSYNDLSEAQQFAGDYKTALVNREKAIKFRDSIFSQETNIKITQLEAQREMDLKEKDVQIVRLRSQVYIVSIVLLVFLISIAITRFVQQRRESMRLSAENELHERRISSQNRILEHIAHIQSHNLRSSVTNILGLSHLFNHEDYSDPVNAEVVTGIAQVVTQMDKDITRVVKEENDLMQANKTKPAEKPAR